ncbi:hypothetical protein [Desertihabitans aurantiacus]|uniref:hypothetical protein n=1 Tax=Desertihabitans aurantiacus TaxID=2282477 RepID=UPI000DF7FA58|nr:hypothetical protein [Desertihabitans aurantiacus]
MPDHPAATGPTGARWRRPRRLRPVVAVPAAPLLLVVLTACQDPVVTTPPPIPQPPTVTLEEADVEARRDGTLPAAVHRAHVALPTAADGVRLVDRP